MKTFTAYVEWDPATNLYVGLIPGIPGAHTQAATLDELQNNLKEVLQLCLEEMGGKIEDFPHFVGLQQIEVAGWPACPLSTSRQWRKFFLAWAFKLFAIQGSHVFFRHSDGRTTTLPCHPGRDLARPLIREILREIELTPNDFQEILVNLWKLHSLGANIPTACPKLTS
jgi:predicted RNA binding protein YcfA (HicA-like mRNA interferase family)/predicted RNase H-like HicB family nuclease